MSNKDKMKVHKSVGFHFELKKILLLKIVFGHLQF